MKLRAKQCKTCPFKRGGVELRPSAMAEIFQYLGEGANHLCHQNRSNTTICLGGRTWQLELWHKRGWITEPTNEALFEEMQRLGVEPEEHICQSKK